MLFGFNFKVGFLAIGFFVWLPTFGQEVLVFSLGCFSSVLILSPSFFTTWLLDLLKLGVARFLGPPTPPYLANPEPRLKKGVG